VYREHEQRLKQFLDAARFGSAGMNDQLNQEFEPFLQQAAARTKSLQQEMEKGRDRLLEINSFREDEAKAVIKAITEFEAKASPQTLLCNIFDSYGIDYEQNSDDTWTMFPGEEMLLPSFPEMPDEGIDASFHRQTALHREDVQFLHWQHPLVRGAMDLVLDTHLGRAAVSAFNSAHTHPALAPWPLVVETLYRIVIPAPRHLQLQRYFPATSKQFMVALSFDSIQDSPKQISVPTDEMQQSLRYIDKHEAFRLVKQYQAELQTLMQHSEHLAKLAMGESVNMAAKAMLETQTAEIRRLVSLKQRNPNVRDSELEYLRNQTLQLHASFKQASVELIAVHVMFGQKAD
jgi:ATP-dependent helicase HepA